MNDSTPDNVSPEPEAKSTEWAYWPGNVHVNHQGIAAYLSTLPQDAARAAVVVKNRTDDREWVHVFHPPVAKDAKSPKSQWAANALDRYQVQPNPKKLADFLAGLTHRSTAKVTSDRTPDHDYVHVFYER